ncbi:dockerin type I domain-containing protein [Novipirellula artificiosorum]|nr:dockerin type I domain-containing protein [Novipirellula artificiosorum]
MTLHKESGSRFRRRGRARCVRRLGRFERLEQRQLLAADLIVDVPYKDVELQMVGDLVQIRDRVDNSILDQALLVDIDDRIEIRSRSFVADSDLALDGNSLFVYAEMIDLTDSEIVTTDFEDLENAGALLFEARQIQVLSGSKLDTQVAPDSTRAAGQITLRAVDRISDLNRFFQDAALPIVGDARNSSLQITGSVLLGRDVILDANGNTLSRYDDVAAYQNDIASGVIDALQQAPQIGISAVSPVSGQVKIHEATSSIVIENAGITSSTWIDIDASATADSSINALAINGTNREFMGSVGFSKSASSATISLLGTTTFDAASYIDVETNATSTAQTTTRSEGGSHFSSGDVDYAFNLAVALTHEVSVIDVGQFVTLDSQGRVNLDAQATVTNKAKADTALFQDGEAAFSVAIGVDNAEVRANIAGNIVSGDTTNVRTVPFSVSDVDATSDQILMTVPSSEPLRVGERITSNTSANTEIGLHDQAEYIVAEATEPVDAGEGQVSQSVRLTRAESLPVDARQVPEESEHTLSKLALIEFPVSAISTESASGDGLIELSLPANVDRVTYLGPDSPNESEAETVAEGIAGLTQNESYEVVRDGVHIKLRSLETGEIVDFTAPADSLDQGFSYYENIIAFIPRDTVDHQTGRITLPESHGLRTGDLLVYGVDPNRTMSREVAAFDAEGNQVGKLGDVTLPDAPIRGLQNNLAYRVIVDPHRPNDVRLASSLVHAELAQTVDLQAVSDGSFSIERLDLHGGIRVNAHLDATNFAQAGVNLTNGQQPWPALIQGASNGQIDDIAQLGFEFIDKLREGIDGNAKQQAESNTQTDSEPNLDAAGSISVAYFDHQVAAKIATTATLRSFGDLSVDATTEQAVKLGVTAESTRNALSEEGGNKEFALGVGVGVYRNTTHAIVDDSATLDALGDTRVRAGVVYPLLPDAEGNQHTVSMGLAGFGAWLSGDLDFTHLTNVYSRSIANGDDSENNEKVLAIGGGVALTFTENEVIARIGGGAQVNQDSSFFAHRRTVSVEADLEASIIEVGQMMSVNLSVPGIVEAFNNAANQKSLDVATFLQDLVNPLGVSGDKAFGGTLIINTTDNRVIAEIESQAAVNASHLHVIAGSDTYNFAGVQTGTGSTEIGFSAAIAASDLTSTTMAAIHEDAAIGVGTLDVIANDDLDRITYAGAVLKGEQVGIGTSIGVNVVEQNVAAFVGREETVADGNPATASPLYALGPAKIAAAATGTVQTIVISGAVQGLGGTLADADSKQTGPIAITAPVAYNSVTTDVDAYMDNQRAEELGALEIDAHAETSTKLLVIGGSFAVQTAAGANSGKLNLAGAGAVGINNTHQTVDATIHDSLVTSLGSITVTATEASKIESDAGGLAIGFGSGPKRGTALSFGTSVAINDVSGHTKATIDRSHLNVGNGDLLVSVASLAGDTDDAPESRVRGMALGGAATLALTPALGTFGGLGAAVQNWVNKTVAAEIINDSVVEIFDGDVSVLARDESKVIADAGGLSFSGGAATKVNGALGIGLSFNEVANSTTARIADSEVRTSGAILVQSNLPIDDTESQPASVDALSVAGSMGIAASQGLSASLAGAGSGSNNQVANTITAEIVESDVESVLHAIKVLAHDATSIIATTVGAAVDAGFAAGLSGAVAVGMSVARNEIGNTTTAKIEGGSTTTSDNDLAMVHVHAADNANINAVAVAASLAVSAAVKPAFSMSGGGAEASNGILSDVDALVKNANVVSRLLSVTADSTATIQSGVYGVTSSVAGSAAPGASASIGASVANNFVGYMLNGTKQDARVHAEVIGSTIDTVNLAVTSDSNQDIDAETFVGGFVIAGAVSFGGAGAGSGTKTTNRISPSVLAKIDGQSAPDIDVIGTVRVEATDQTRIDANTTAVTVAGFVGGAAGGAVQVGISLAENIVDNRVEALIASAAFAETKNPTVTVAAEQSESSRINAASVATSVSGTGAAGIAGGISGAGASSVNTVSNKTLATIRNSQLYASKVNVTADSHTDTKSQILNASVATGFSLAGGGGLGVGINDAHNVIGDITDDRSLPEMANQITASIEGNTTIVSTGLVSVLATNSDSITAAMNANVVSAAGSPELAASVAGAGTAAYNKVASEIAARIAGTSADARVVIDSADSVNVAANDESKVNTTVGTVTVSAMIGTFASGASISVSKAESDVHNLLDASIQHATVNAVNDINVSAVEDGDIETVSYTTAVGATLAIGANVTGGGAVAYGRMRSDVDSQVALSDLNAGAKVSVASIVTAEVNSDTKPVGVSVLGLAGFGSVPTAIVQPTVDSLVSSTAVTSDDLEIKSTYNPLATAEAFGFQVAVGASFGGSDATVTVGGVIDAQLSSGDRLVDVERLTIRSAAVPLQDSASSAIANASSGGLLMGTNSAYSEAIDTSEVQANIANGSNNIQVGELTTVEAESRNLQRSETDAYTGGLISVGVPTARVDNNLKTKALLGNNVQITGGNLLIRATGHSNALSDANAGSGGVSAGSVTQSKVANRSTTEAVIGDASVLNVESVIVDANFLTQTNAVLGAVAGGVLSGQGGFVYNDVTATVSANVGSNASIEATNIDIDAKQYVAKPDLGDAGNVDATTGGLITGGGAGSHTALVMNTAVNIGSGATLRATGGDAATLALSAANWIDATDRLTVRAGGAGAQTHVDSSIIANQMNAQVIVGDGASLSSTGTIEMDATGTADTRIQANSDAYGPVTIGSGSSEITLRPRNEIDLQGNASLRADLDIILSAGIDTFDESNYDVEARMDTFGGSVIPLEFIDATATLLEKNKINVASGAVVESGGNIGLHAERHGENNVAGIAKAVNWVSGLRDVLNGTAAEGGVEISTRKLNSAAFGVITVNGTLRTGINRHRELVIAGVQLSDNGDPNNADDYNVDAQGDIPFSQRIEMIESGLHADLRRAQEQLAEYGDNVGIRNFYQSEITRLENELRTQGLLVRPEANAPELASEQNAVVVMISDIFAQAGRIDVSGDRLVGTGEIDAPGDATIEVTNQSLVHIEVSGMQIADSTGGVWFNHVGVSEASLGTIGAINSAITEENATQTDILFLLEPEYNAAADFSSIVGGAGAPDPSISVRNTAVTSTVDDVVYPWPNISVIGAPLRNLGGSIELTNHQSGAGSIIITAEIVAAELVTRAGNLGTATINLPGVGSIHEVRGTEFADIHNQLYNAHTFKGIVPIEASFNSNSGFTNYLAAEPTTPSISASRIFIEAHFINVNGLIQSGKSDFNLTIDQEVAEEIAWGINNGVTGIVPLENQPSAGFVISFDYERLRIVVSELIVGGGYVELTGNVANTRQGEIRVFGGYANINIDNQTNYDIELQRLDASRRGEGKVIINDLARGDGTIPESYHYIRKGDLVEQSRYLLNGEVHHELFELDDEMIYLPKPYLRYGWVVAEDSSTISRRTLRSSSWLGAIDAFAPDAEVFSTSGPTTLDAKVHGSGAFFFTANDQTSRPRYSYAERNYTADDTGWEAGKPWEQWTGAFLWAVRNVYYPFTRKQKTLTLHSHSIRADRPIDIEFLGNATGKIDIKSAGRVFVDGVLTTSNGTVKIQARSIQQSSGAALVQSPQITLSSTLDIGSHSSPILTDVLQNPRYDYRTDDGAVPVMRGQRVLVVPDFQEQGTVGDIYEFLPKARAIIDVGVEDFTSDRWQRIASPASLSATTRSGNLFVHEVAGDLPVGLIKTAFTPGLLNENDVQVTAAGSIVVGQLAGGSQAEGLIAGNSVVLHAQRGSIGDLGDPNGDPSSQAKPLNVQVSAISFRNTLEDRLTATASGDIVMHHPGNVVINEIRAGGAVHLSSTGTIIDGNKVDIRDERALDALRSDVWADLRLTEQFGASERRQERLDALVASQSRDYHQYWEYRNTQTDSSSYDENHRVELSEDELAFYDDEYRQQGSEQDLEGDDLEQFIADSITTIENNRTTQYHALHPNAGPLGDAYDRQYQYQATADDELAIDDSMKVWTEEELLNTNRPGEVLDISDTEFVIEDANITGTSVTITDALAIGQYQNGRTIALRDDDGQPATLTLDQRAAILTAEPNDLVYLSQEQLYSELILFNNQIRYQQLLGDTRIWADFGFEVGQLIYLEGNTRETTDEGVFYEILELDGPLMTVDLEGKTPDGQFEYVPSTKMHIAAVVPDQNPDEANFLRVLRREDIDLATAGVVNASSQRNVFIGSEGDLRLGQITAGGDRRVQIKAHGDLINASETDLPMITGQRVVLESSVGSIGSMESPLRMNLSEGGYLIARANGAVELEQTNATEDADDLSINQIFSRNASISITADGAILDFFDTDGTNIRSQGLVLHAGGSIGSIGNPLEINLTDTGTLTAIATQEVVITETVGDMNLRQVLSQAGDVILVADISILDAVDVQDASHPESADSDQIEGLPRVDIIGNNITLTANLAAIGSVGNEIDIDSRFGDGDGNVSLRSGANAYVIETTGDFYLGRIDTDDETAFLAAPGGGIYTGLARDQANVLGGKLWLFARDHIGAADNPITTTTSAIEGQATTGDVFIENTGDVTLGGVVDPPATAEGEDTGSDAATRRRGASGLEAGQALSIRSDRSIMVMESLSALGDIEVVGEVAVRIPVGTAVESPGSVRFSSRRPEILGTVKSSETVVAGTEGDDTVIVNPESLLGTLSIETLAGDDHIDLAANCFAIDAGSGTNTIAHAPLCSVLTFTLGSGSTVNQIATAAVENISGLPISTLQILGVDAPVVLISDPRFEYSDGTLRLRSGELISTDEGESMIVSVDFSDPQSPENRVTHRIAVTITANDLVWQNPTSIYDVNQRDGVSALDALLILNELASRGAGPLGARPYQSQLPFFDTTGDGSVTALDALRVINQLALQVGASGESIAAETLPEPVHARHSEAWWMDTRDDEDENELDYIDLIAQDLHGLT